MKRCIVAKANTEQEHPAIQIVDARKWRTFSQPILQRVSSSDVFGMTPPGSEGICWVIAAQNTGPYTEGFNNFAHLARGSYQWIKGRHGIIDYLPPDLGHWRVPPLGRIGEISRKRRHHNRP